MRGVWTKESERRYTLRTPDNAVHAVVEFRDDRYADPDKPWLVYTRHTEGNDRFETARKAKAHARKRLESLLEATESLRC